MGDNNEPGNKRTGTTLTERQRTILDVIRASVSTRGYPPSIRVTLFADVFAHARSAMPSG